MDKEKIDFLVNHACNNNFRNSNRNLEKIRNLGFEPLEKIHLFGSYSMCFVNYHGGIKKIFYKGNMEIKKETFLRKMEGYYEN